MIFMPFPRFVGPICAPPPFAITNVASMKHSASSRALCREARWLRPSTLAAKLHRGTRFESADERICSSDTLRQHVPLRASVDYPQYSFENTSGRDRLASRTSIGDVLFRKMIPDALPLLVCQPNHPTFIADRLRLAILR